MKLYRYTFPIPNYTNDDVFEQHVYVEAENCPTEDEMRKMLVDKILQWDQLPSEHKMGYDNPWEACFHAMTNVLRFPRVSGDLMATNSFSLTKWGKQPLSVRVIEPWSIEDASKGDV